MIRMRSLPALMWVLGAIRSSRSTIHWECKTKMKKPRLLKIQKVPVFILAASLTIPPMAMAADSVRVSESVFDQFASVAGPFQTKGRHVIRIFTMVLCGNWTASVSNLKFNITPAGVDITGSVDARYHCGSSWVPFSGALSTAATVEYQPDQKVVELKASSTRIKPVFTVPVLNQRITIPVNIDIGPSLSFSVPINAAKLHYQTAQNEKYLWAIPSAIDLDLEEGFIRLNADIILR